jgi:hypothetical protein
MQKDGEGHSALVRAIENSNRQVHYSFLNLETDPDVAFGIFPSSIMRCRALR